MLEKWLSSFSSVSKPVAGERSLGIILASWTSCWGVNKTPGSTSSVRLAFLWVVAASFSVLYLRFGGNFELEGWLNVFGLKNVVFHLGLCLGWFLGKPIASQHLSPLWPLFPQTWHVWTLFFALLYIAKASLSILVRWSTSFWASSCCKAAATVSIDGRGSKSSSWLLWGL